MAISYSLGITKNSDNVPSSGNIVYKASTNGGVQLQANTFYTDYPSVGFNEYWPVEYVSAETVTVNSSNNSVDFGGIQATWRC